MVRVFLWCCFLAVLYNAPVVATAPTASLIWSSQWASPISVSRVSACDTPIAGDVASDLSNRWMFKNDASAAYGLQLVEVAIKVFSNVAEEKRFIVLASGEAYSFQLTAPFQTSTLVMGYWHGALGDRDVRALNNGSLVPNEALHRPLIAAHAEKILAIDQQECRVFLNGKRSVSDAPRLTALEVLAGVFMDTFTCGTRESTSGCVGRIILGSIVIAVTIFSIVYLFATRAELLPDTPDADRFARRVYKLRMDEQKRKISSVSGSLL